MLLIWGFKVRYKLLAEDHFFCPHEGGDRLYRRKQARKWFTFFWIPIIPLKILGEFIECATCGSTYETTVLTLPTASQIEDQLTRALRHVVVAMLHSGGSVDGNAREAAVEVVRQFANVAYDAAALDSDLTSLQVADLEHELVAAAGMLSSHGQETMLKACLTLAVADGHINDDELKTIEHAGRSLGMSAAHVRGVLAEVTQTTPGRTN